MAVNAEEQMGINDSGIIYHKILPEQDRLLEFKKTNDFLRDVFCLDEKVKEKFGKPLQIQFINYGDTELVYVLTTDKGKYAALVGQPSIPFGIVKKEYDNLRTLGSKYPDDVVIPIDYFSSPERELYIAPYLPQARCIASGESGWGLYIPEPLYHFKKISDQQRLIVNSSMIALLLKLYDEEKNIGLASCKIGGGDFILQKNWSLDTLSQESTLNNMHLIAARNSVSIPFEDYVRLIRDEFSKRTYYSTESGRDKSVIVNHKSRCPMSLEEIDKGIELGMHLRKKK